MGNAIALARPSHVITFLRKEHLPPNEACFRVPLQFTKFDLRDYLWNVYDVEVRRVRVYVKEQPLERRENGLRTNRRPQAQKIMTVELAKPFQWPDLPKNRDPWSQALWQKREDIIDDQQKDQSLRQKAVIPLKCKAPLSHERQALARLAKELLDGRVKWSNGVTLDPKWDALLAESRKGKAGVPADDQAAKTDASSPSR
ncbi:hypothetical protein CDD83_7353 [Cordyceps sp. RAO-2017]|nr:hypothetical protein CDD83_7353 [Cordyceps sp. RAO-2017]